MENLIEMQKNNPYPGLVSFLDGQKNGNTRSYISLWAQRKPATEFLYIPMTEYGLSL
jgi:hypothetical protein